MREFKSMKKLIAFIMIFIIFIILSCKTIIKDKDYSIPPEVCFIYSDESGFILCVEHRILAFRVFNGELVFKGIPGKCDCDKEINDNFNDI